MTTLFVAMEQVLLVVRGGEAGWRADVYLPDTSPQCVAVDPLRPERAYCGTFGQGLWRSDDAGVTWRPAGDGITRAEVMAVAVSPLERSADHGVVYAGTEPSVLYRSVDGGDSWQMLSGMTDLPSSSTWSFPPRPHTHHVRYIAFDPVVAGRMFVCIEAGALVQSPDAGRTWQDRVPDGPYDTHTLVTHPLAPGRLYSAAGDGYFESHDGGTTWQQPDAGLRHHYLYGLAVDPTDPETILASAASSAFQAHYPTATESLIYRKTVGQTWQPIHDGLPDSKGTIISVLAADAARPGEFYAANNRGVYRSVDSGSTWERIDIPWPQAYRAQHAWGLAVVEKQRVPGDRRQRHGNRRKQSEKR